MFTLEEAYKSLEDRPEFAVKEYRERLVSINYLITLPDSFEGIRKNFRGVTFDKKTGKIISLPFHKFYNVNQRDETQYHLIKDLKATVYEKMDGSMIHFFREPTSNAREFWKIEAATRMSCETDQAKEAYLFALRRKELWTLIEEHIDKGYTPLFEFVSPSNQIVVEYPKARLVYLHSRNCEDGTYWFDERFEDKAQRYQIDFCKIFEELHEKKEFEGYVCVLENGMWVKAKCNWYQERHNAVDALMKPAYKLYEIALDGQMDDLLVACPDRFRPRLEEIAKETSYAFALLRCGLYEMATESWESVGKTDRKAFVFHVQKKYKDMFSALMAIYDGREPTDWIKMRLMEGYRMRYPQKLFAELQQVDEA